MPISNIWVFAEAFDGKVKTITLEILAKAREIADTVECFYGGDGDDVGWAGGGQEIVEVAQAEARQAGEIVEDEGDGFTKVVAFLENLKVI